MTTDAGTRGNAISTEAPMSTGSPSRNWMFAEAVEMLARAERLSAQLFDLHAARSRGSVWVPPADVIETEGELIILVALPGVPPEQVRVEIEGGTLVVSGRRTLPPQLRNAVIHRLELPQGQFERRIPLPPGHYDQPRRGIVDGCTMIVLRKLA
ncbi:Hsp20/alpha crystallin family protein [Roseomonas chloroacetimidivorans]|uniref:Hsp20/alpha crystallin family protein n=1 Tax=Roseomonas chloroacetimidivorans TaxID=1766656 RepID=UPI003C789222